MVMVLISIGLMGCSSNSVDKLNEKSKEGNPTTKTSVKRDFVFMSDLVSALKDLGVDCKDYVKAEGKLIVKEEGNCQYNGVTLTLDIFGDAKTTTELVDSLKSFGGYWLTSNNWVIVTEDEKTARDLQEKLQVQVK